MTDEADPWLLVEPHRQRLIRMAYRRLANWQDAEDIAQEAMIRVATYEALDHARVGELLTSATVRLCINALAHRAVVAAKAPDQHVPASDPFEKVLDEAEAHFLLTVPLTKVERTLLIARIHGLYPSEVAESLGLTVYAAKSALFRARRKIIAAWKATLGLIGVCRLRRLALPVGGAMVLAVAALVLRLPSPRALPAWEHEASVEVARVPVVRPMAPRPSPVSRPAAPMVRTERVSLGTRPSPSATATASVALDVPGMDVRGIGVHNNRIVIDMSEHPVDRARRCARNGMDFEPRSMSLTCRE